MSVNNKGIENVSIRSVLNYLACVLKVSISYMRISPFGI